jgi:serine/alanine adding enzyme
MALRIVSSLDERNWRYFVENHPKSNVFHTPEMFQVFARVKGHRPTLWAVEGEDAQILALLLPVEIALKDGPLRRLTTRAVAYGSVLADPSRAGEEALELLLRIYKQKVGHEALFTELRNLSDLSVVQPILNVCGFAYEDHLNYLIDLGRPVEEVMQSIGRRTRKKIRRGLREGAVVVEEVADPSKIATCYELLERTYEAARVPLADRSLFEAAFDVLYPLSMVKFWLVWVGETCVATSVELLFKDVVYGWYGGVDRNYSDYVPGELLMWHLLQWSVENNYRVYDFGGAGKPDEEYGVRDFKAKFGGELVCFGRNTCVHSPGLLRLSELGYRVYRNLIYRL